MIHEQGLKTLAAVQARIEAAKAREQEALPPVLADVENDGNRGARPSRDPLASIDAAADGQHARAVAGLVEAVAGLHVDEVRAVTWLVRQLPGRKLRARCEEATARGWVDRTSRGTGWSATPEELVRSSWLGTWRAVIALVIGPTSAAAGDVARRDREDVLRDERERRAR